MKSKWCRGVAMVALLAVFSAGTMTAAGGHQPFTLGHLGGDPLQGMSNVQVADMAEIDVATPTKLLFVAAAAFVGRIAWRLGDLLSDWVTDWLRDGSTIDFAAAGEAFGTLDESIFDRY